MRNPNKLVLVFLIGFYSIYSFSQESLGKERIGKIKKSVVKILVNGDQVGTGFFISEKNIATCYHVVFGDNKNYTVPNKIQIIRDDTCKINVIIPKYCSKSLGVASIYDYCVLQILETKDILKNQTFLKVGNFKDVNEGDWVLSCGYPLGINNPFVSTGLFSTKWNDTVVATQIKRKDTTLLKISRDVAWLDLTLNHGNSGGPIILLGKTSADDIVVGIASFILNPYAAQAIGIRDFALKSVKNVGMIYNGTNQLQVNAMFGEAIGNYSIGISGCISIDYFNQMLSD